MLEQLFFLAILGIIITLKQYTIYPAGWETKKRNKKGRPSVPESTKKPFIYILGVAML